MGKIAWAAAVMMLATAGAAAGRPGAGRETVSLDGEWAFEVTGGRRAGEKTTITVPSCWETQGFGTWQYGYNIEFGDKWHGHEKPADEHGLYSRTFTVPSEGVVVLRTDRDDARGDYGGRRGDEARRFRWRRVL